MGTLIKAFLSSFVMFVNRLSVTLLIKKEKFVRIERYNAIIFKDFFVKVG